LSSFSHVSRSHSTPHCCLSKSSCGVQPEIVINAQTRQKH
jgi:hypothetical protein